MVCPKCGSPVSEDDETCSNCGSDLDREGPSSESLAVKSEGLRKMSEELKAVSSDEQMFSEDETIADRFVVDELVEEGPFGEVYRAHDDIIETDVALKIFEDDLLRTPPEREEFLEATRAARSMTQKNVVRIHDSGVHEDYPWVSMQYLEGLTLRKTISLREKKDEQFALEEIEPVVTQVTLALQHIGREFPNADLKPNNIFFLPDLLKVTDGYLYGALPSDVFAERLGDSDYIAPELDTDPDSADARSDVYSLGVIIGEMAFGSNYEPGTEGSDPETGALEELIRRATAFDPAERYPTVEALSEDFSTLVDTGQLLERPSSGSASVAPPGAGTPPEPPGPDVTEPVDEVDAEMREEELEEFPEDEIATRDYERDDGPPPESAIPPGPTNEVDRDSHPAPESVGPEAPTEEVDRDSDKAPPEPPAASEQGGGDDEGLPASYLIGGFIVALVGAVGLLIAFGSGDDDVVDISEQADAGADAARAAADDIGTDEAGETGEEMAEGPDPENVLAAIEASRPGAEEALAAARSAAEEKGKELEEEQEEDDGSGAGDDRATGSTASRGRGGRAAEPEDQGTDCPDGMVLVERDSGNYCIDRFEYPGQGQKPKTNATWFDAKAACRKAGKRLCKLSEWRRACGSKYPWGSSWDPNKCNTRDEAGFARSLKPTGSFEECRSWTGTYDMVGNAIEWVSEQKIVGGAFHSGKEVASCRYASNKEPGSAARAIGFRCCADPE